MSGVWGKNIQITIFGQSHSRAIGGVISGIDSGIEIDVEEIKKQMARRSSKGGDMETPRAEKDNVEIVSGILDNRTTGDPICGIIYNEDVKSKDYTILKDIVRPSHSDYGYYVKRNAFNDYRGGGQSSGRMTAPIVFCGSIIKQILSKKYGIDICAHVLSIANVVDKRFSLYCEETDMLSDKEIPIIDSSIEDLMKNEVLNARKDGDSVGGTIECCVKGIAAGIGNPIFESIESKIAHMMFSIPAIKGVEFGKGFDITKLRGSIANDSFFVKDSIIQTKTNNNGGVLGGISTGMPIVFDVAVKPTPSIFKEQNTINVVKKENTKLKLEGRHDPCIVIRAVPVIEAATAIAIYDLIKSN